MEMSILVKMYCKSLEKLETDKLRIGVALGGGSARGYAHIGALATLEQYNIKPSVIAGTSFGAVIGAIYASGKSPAEMAEIAKSMRRRDLFSYVGRDLGLGRVALFTGNGLERYYRDVIGDYDIKDLEKELIVVTTDVDTGERVLLDSGDLARALRASSAIPGIFASVDIDGRRLVDGGLGSPIPFESLKRDDIDLVIGIGAGTTSEESVSIRRTKNLLNTKWGKSLHNKLENSSNTNPFSRLGRGLAYTANTYMLEPKPLLLQVHTMPPINWLEFNKAELAIDAGKKALEAFMPRILADIADLKNKAA